MSVCKYVWQGYVPFSDCSLAGKVEKSQPQNIGDSMRKKRKRNGRGKENTEKEALCIITRFTLDPSQN